MHDICIHTVYVPTTYKLYVHTLLYGHRHAFAHYMCVCEHTQYMYEHYICTNILYTPYTFIYVPVIYTLYIYMFKRDIYVYIYRDIIYVHLPYIIYAYVICICIYTDICVYICICIYIYICIYRYMCIYTDMYIYILLSLSLTTHTHYHFGPVYHSSVPLVLCLVLDKYWFSVVWILEALETQICH